MSRLSTASWLPLCVFIAADLCVVLMVWTCAQGTWQVATESYARVVAAFGDMATGHRIRCVPYLFQARGSVDMATGHRSRVACSGRGGTWPEATETERVPLGSGGDMARGHSKPPREIPPGKRHEADALVVADCRTARPLWKLQKKAWGSGLDGFAVAAMRRKCTRHYFVGRSQCPFCGALS